MRKFLQRVHPILVAAAIITTSVWGAVIATPATHRALAQEAYSASIRSVAGGKDLDEVQLFEDNFVRCYIAKDSFRCFAK